MEALQDEVDRIVHETGFSGVVRIDRGDQTEVAKAYGLAHRGLQVPNTLDTQFGIASGVKGLTALAVIGLVEDGLLQLSTTARSVLGDHLPMIDDAVTVEHLLAHRSGIGDYLDEDTDLDITAYPMPVPVQELATTEQYLAVLGGHPTKFAPGERFSYCNGGFVVLALIA
ncbi:MAG TPA: serine hydrolase domain-containing protein, partial [Ilumatobacteraceae bacterium]|nr:serine hydrolase domain-containing protein [Ilumatobacteraceae bacterium]